MIIWMFPRVQLDYIKTDDRGNGREVLIEEFL